MIVTRTRAIYFVGLLALVLLASLSARPAEAQVQMPVADLSVQKFDFPPDQVAVGETLFYEVSIANLGMGTATDAMLTDTLPANTQFLSTFSGDCTNVGQTITCDLGDLEPNEEARVEFSVCPTEPGTATNTATASSATPDSNPMNDTATETTEVTTPAVGSCPSQEPPPDNPNPGPPPNPTPPPAAPDPPQTEEPVADAGLCAPGAVAIRTEDFSLACAGGQAIALRGDAPEGTLVGDGPSGEDTAGTRAVAGDGGVFVQKP